MSSEILNIEEYEMLAEQSASYYSGNSLVYKNEVYDIISCCFEVHNLLGRGFSEIVYKDALEYELRKKAIDYEREKKFEIQYKEIVLSHNYYADFVIYDDIIFEVKAQTGAIDIHYKQVLNYLAVSGCKLGLIVNFGEDKLVFKRIIL